MIFTHKSQFSTTMAIPGIKSLAWYKVPCLLCHLNRLELSFKIPYMRNPFLSFRTWKYKRLPKHKPIAVLLGYPLKVKEIPVVEDTM